MQKIPWSVDAARCKRRGSGLMEWANGREREARDGSRFPVFIHACGWESNLYWLPHTINTRISHLQWGTPSVHNLYPLHPATMSNSVTCHKATTITSRRQGDSIFSTWRIFGCCDLLAPLVNPCTLKQRLWDDIDSKIWCDSDLTVIWQLV